jgi:ankyrin repeat protein
MKSYKNFFENIRNIIDKDSPDPYINGYLKTVEDKLDYAIQINDLTNINKYIKLVDINWQDDVGQSFMNTVLRAQNLNISRKIKIIKLLISHGYYINLKNINEQTSIYFTYNKKIAKILIDAGIDLESKDIYNNTYYEHILWFKYKSIIPLIEYLMSINVKYNLDKSLFVVSMNHDIQKIVFFTKLGANWKYKENNKYFIENLTKKEIIELIKQLPEKFKVGIFKKYVVNITRKKFNL